MKPNALLYLGPAHQLAGWVEMPQTMGRGTYNRMGETEQKTHAFQGQAREFAI